MNGNPEFTIDRMFDAPRDLVWRAWTEPELLSQWFGPKGCRIDILAFDLRPGGICHYALHVCNAPLTFAKFVYQEVLPPETISWHQSFADEKGTRIRRPGHASWPLVLLTRVRFEEQGHRTRMLFSWTPLDALPDEITEFTSTKLEMNLGWAGSFEQLEPLLERLCSGTLKGKTI